MGETDANPPAEEITACRGGTKCRIGRFQEYKTTATLFGLPLVHCVSWPIKPGTKGLYFAKGIVAVGLLSVGVVAIGCVALGFLVLCNLGIGVFSVGNIVLGAVAANGNIAAAIGWANGNIAAGYRAHGQVVAEWAK